MNANQKGFLFGGLVLMVAIVISLLLYKATEPADREGLRQLFVITVWVALFLGVTGILLTRYLTVKEVKAHERGMDKGLEKVAAMADKVATTRTNMVTTIKRPPEGWAAPQAQSADYLPRPRLTFNHSAADETIEV